MLLLATAGGGLLALLWWFDPKQIGIPACGLYLATGLHCPGCGATRATHELLHGRLLSALHYNGFWVLVLPMVLYAAASELRRFTHGRPLPGDLAARPRWWIAVAVLSVVFFVLRNVPAYPLNLLAPPSAGS